MIDLFSFNNSHIVNLQSKDRIEDFRHAGKTVSTCLTIARGMIEKLDCIDTMDIEQSCIGIIKNSLCEPTFHGFCSYPGYVCISIDKETVHGIASRNRKIKPGDVVKVDVGATYKGAIGDAAITAICGTESEPKHRRLVDKCSEILDKSISSLSVGDRIGKIGEGIFKLSRESEFYTITAIGGHGIDIDKMHCEPFVSNKSNKNEGIRIQPGMVFTIEPILTTSNNTKIKIASDGWTVLSDGITAHMEHTLFAHSNWIEILTV